MAIRRSREKRRIPFPHLFNRYILVISCYTCHLWSYSWELPHWRSQHATFSSFRPSWPTTTCRGHFAGKRGTRLWGLWMQSVPDDQKPPTSPEVVYFSPNAPLRLRADDLPSDSAPDDTRPISALSEEPRPDTLTPANSVSSMSMNEYSFFDEAIIYVRAGSGGQGATTFALRNNARPSTSSKRNLPQQGPPDGGNGGLGGHIYLVVDPSLNTLAGLTPWVGAAGGTGRPQSFRAEHGQPGGPRGRDGGTGQSVFVRVPPGTRVQQRPVQTARNSTATQDEDVALEENMYDWQDVVNLTVSGQEWLIARGGRGGEGNGVVALAGRGVARPRQAAAGGERKWLQLTLQLLADVALVGVPNAGKSTFLASVTRAKPRIANYPFTTVVPNLGVWTPPFPLSLEVDDGGRDSFMGGGAGSDGLVLCDVPGLIAGAASGVGLGHAFLRHVERCHVILHLVDATSDDPIADYEMVNRELVRYGTGQLAEMPQVVVVNKLDLLDETDRPGSSSREAWEQGLQTKWSRSDLEAKLREVLPHSRLMWMSAKERQGVDDLMQRLATFVKKVKNAKPGP